jgi:hypothetical protein
MKRNNAMKNTDRVSININWESETSIEESEKKKESLENKGYQLISHFGGMKQSVMIYQKQQ